MGLEKDGEFTFGRGEFELLMLFRKKCSGKRCVCVGEYRIK